jgi:rod shape-determining protein MreD
LRRHLAAAALAVGLLTLQTTFGGAAGPFGLHADLPLVFVLWVGMRHGGTAGALWGLGLGYAADIFSAGQPGANILTAGLLGFAAGSLREQLDCDNPNTQAIVAVLATLAQGAAHLVLLGVFSAGRGVRSPFLGTIVPAAAVNGVLLPVADSVRRAWARRQGRRLAAGEA